MPADTNRTWSSKLEAFCAERNLPTQFKEFTAPRFAELGHWFGDRLPQAPGNAPVLGISGAQGTGKSTLSAFLQLFLKHHFEWSVVTLSLDDVYLTRKERRSLAENVHPLLATRGVPGTHDLDLAAQVVGDLCQLGDGQTLLIPRFDKATDDRKPESEWPLVTGPIDLLILEGWCLGAEPVEEAALSEPINELESEHDPDGRWRQFVNSQLHLYQALFSRVDSMVFLQAPAFDSVYEWREKQESALRCSSVRKTDSTMSPQEVVRFVQLFERVTRQSQSHLKLSADAVVELNAKHQVRNLVFR